MYLERTRYFYFLPGLFPAQFCFANSMGLENNSAAKCAIFFFANNDHDSDLNYPLFLEIVTTWNKEYHTILLRNLCKPSTHRRS